MGFIDVSKLNTGVNSNRSLGTFKINGIIFNGMGHGMLETSNVVTYKETPGRTDDFSMPDLPNQKRRVVPHVKLGFKWIEADDFVRLRRLLMMRGEMTVEYYDNDFGQYITHKMYAVPDDLKAFESLGQRVIGLSNFSVELVGTMNDEPFFSAFVEVDTNNVTRVWRLGTSYTANTYVKADDRPAADIYKCLQNTSSAALDNTAYWEKVNLTVMTSETSVQWGGTYQVPQVPSQYSRVNNKNFAGKYVDKNNEEFYVGETVSLMSDLVLRAVYN